jgi:hypothetical protein
VSALPLRPPMLERSRMPLGAHIVASAVKAAE